jgi:hypothetical protein
MSKNTKPEQPAPFPVFQITITAMSNGQINVNNFPESYSEAMKVFHAAQHAVVRHFFQGIADNRYDANGVKKGSNIVIAKANELPV